MLSPLFVSAVRPQFRAKLVLDIDILNLPGPMQAAVMYNDGTLRELGGVSDIVGLAIIAGQITAGLFAIKIGKTRIQCMVVFLVGGVFLACKFNFKLLVVQGRFLIRY
jgi:MFS family permease